MVEVCRKIGVSEATFYARKKKYGEVGVSELRKLRMLEDENALLKRVVADLTLDRRIPQEVVREKDLEAAKRRELAAWMKGALSDSSLKQMLHKYANVSGILGGFEGWFARQSFGAH